MFVVNKFVIEEFVNKHSDSRIPMAEWLEKTEAAGWGNFVEVKGTFNSADYVRPYVVFNIGGNNYRLVSEIVYLKRTVNIYAALTHKEYDKWKPQ